MTTPQLSLALILVGTLVLFVWGRFRHDLVAVLTLLASVLVGVVKPEEAFTGFSDPAVITVALVLILSAAIRNSGLPERAVRHFSPLMARPSVHVALMTAAVTALSAFMNNVGAVAVMMPVAIMTAEKANRSPGTLLMPVAFGSLLGGLITLIGTPPNLLISAIREDTIGRGYAMFDFAAVGLPIALIGVLYLSVAWRLLPRDRKGTPSPERRFRVEDYVTEAHVPPHSPLVGKSVRDLEKLGEEEMTVVAVIRDEAGRLAPSRWMRLEAGDIVVLEADSAVLKRVVDVGSLDLVGSKELHLPKLSSEHVGIAEAVVTRSSQLVGRSPADFRLRDWGLNLLAVTRQGRRATTRISNQQLTEGDVVVLQGDLEQMPFKLQELGLLPLAERKIELGQPARVFLPAFALGAAVVATTTGLVPIAISLLAAVAAIALFRVMRLNAMYEAIDWSVIVLLGALIPVTAALQSTGSTELIASMIAAAGQTWPPAASITLVLIATMLVTPLLNNAATVLLMGPIAAGLAIKLGYSVDPFLMAVAIGASCDFLTPFGHQSNTLVMGPGGYRFGDYARLGLPLSLIVAAAAVPLIMFAWPLASGP